MQSLMVCQRRLVFVLLLAGLVIPLSTITAQQNQDQIPVPTIRVSTRLVLVDVVVRDKNGQAITGLKPDDFVVEENGKKQKIATFVPPAQAQAATAPPTLAPGLFTDRPDFRSPGGPPTVILLDAANASFKDQAYARLQMLKYVVGQLKPGQRVAVFALTNGLHMIQDFTGDPRVLQEALEHYRPQEPTIGTSAAPAISSAAGSPDFKPGVSAELAAVGSAVATFQSASIGYDMNIRIQDTLDGMRALGRALGGIPGRKEVIWLTAAFPFDLLPQNTNMSDAEAAMMTQGIQQMSLGTRAAGSAAEYSRQSNFEEIRQTAADLSSAQVAIYPVDVRGLVSGTETMIQGSSAQAQQVLDNPDLPLAKASSVTDSQETMREIASETGGRAYINQNDIKDGVALAMADNAASYTIGYYSENKKWDGKYRKIKVTVDRDHAELLHRQGYFAVDPTQSKDSKAADQEVAAAMRTNVPATQITFSARAKKNDKGKVVVDFLVDARTLSTEDASGGKKKLDFSYYAAIFSPEGKIVTMQSMKVDQAFPDETFQKILQQGILLHLDLDTAPAPNEQLRLVVQDKRTGFIGSTVGPLAVQ